MKPSSLSKGWLRWMALRLCQGLRPRLCRTGVKPGAFPPMKGAWGGGAGFWDPFAGVELCCCGRQCSFHHHLLGSFGFSGVGPCWPSPGKGPQGDSVFAVNNHQFWQVVLCVLLESDAKGKPMLRVSQSKWQPPGMSGFKPGYRVQSPPFSYQY